MRGADAGCGPSGSLLLLPTLTPLPPVYRDPRLSAAERYLPDVVAAVEFDAPMCIVVGVCICVVSAAMPDDIITNSPSSSVEEDGVVAAVARAVLVVIVAVVVVVVVAGVLLRLLEIAGVLLGTLLPSVARGFIATPPPSLAPSRTAAVAVELVPLPLSTGPARTPPCGTVSLSVADDDTFRCRRSYRSSLARSSSYIAADAQTNTRAQARTCTGTHTHRHARTHSVAALAAMAAV